MTGRLTRFILILAVSLIGCGGAYKAGQQMSEGERLFRANCRSCHLLPRPAKHTDAEWPGLVKRYGEKIRLADSSQAAIIEFLNANN
ncbi:MAG: hypothetical protein AB1690_09710 [Candidatus Zixiibacteriota bacterium]|jgi:cytochrome c5